MSTRLKTRTSIIYSAILKYGYSNFNLEILEYCDKRTVIKREQHYIDNLKPEYNILKAVNSRLGSKHTLETKTLISLRLKGVNNPNYGKIVSDETRKRISESLKSLRRVKRESAITVKTRLKMSLRCQGVKIKVINISLNSSTIFPTISSVAKHFGISNTTVSRYLDKDKDYKGFLFESDILCFLV